MRKNKKVRLVALCTEYEKVLANSDIPYSEYPRPQMKRESYLCLNGEWGLAIKRKGETVFDGKILVPFVPESRISGVEREIEKDDIIVYSRTFSLPEGFLKDRLLVHVGACDQYAKLFVNGTLVGENVGGYLPFTFDITELLREGENQLTVEARDPLDLELPYGKQTDKRGGMWYTKISGIWQTVWLESVPESYIKRVKLTPDLCGVDVEIEGGEEEKTLYFEGKEYRFSGSKYRLDVDEPKLWTPEDPYLYDLAVESGDDRVETYFGLRTVGIEKRGESSFIALNGKPYFCHGLLDQGYYPDGIFLPATPEGFEDDICEMKKCGFNMLRKHIKLEPELFYYYCDKHGMLVFQDMINSGKYSFFIDTALPTVFLKKDFEHSASARRRELFEAAAKGITEALYSHPSVVYYTIFNEGWGQFDADKYYGFCKQLDGTRVYDTTSGWFKKKLSDVDSEHVYFKPIKLKNDPERPLVLSEFGGYSCKIEGHSFNLDKTYGYRFFEKREDFEEALEKLYRDEVMAAIEKNALSAAVLTQVSDVEDETNGLLTYDRKMLKVSPERMKKLADELIGRFEELYL